MIIIITGASHTGKTRLAQRMLNEYGYPYVSEDHIKMGLIRSGYTQLTPEDDDQMTVYLWPVIREMIKTAVENRQNLVVEGCYVPFDWQSDFTPEYLRYIRYICLCFSDSYIDAHFRDIKEYASCIENRLDDGYCTPEQVKEDNRRYREGCAGHGLQAALIEDDYMSTVESLLNRVSGTAYYHLPGLFEFYDFYKVFLPLFREHREYFYNWADIASVYGAPDDCLWGGGRFGSGDVPAEEAAALMHEYGISARLTFSNSLLRPEHLNDKKCNGLCALFENSGVQNGVIVHSDLLLDHLKHNYPGLYFVSSTTKVLTDFDLFTAELKRSDFRYVVPDFRLNRQFDRLEALTAAEKDKVEFLCNECCYVGCGDRKVCYENVSRRILGEDCPEHVCRAPGAGSGYLFSKAMKNPMFIGLEDIRDRYLPAGFTNFKIEGRSLGSALLLEFLLYYLTKPEHRLEVREHMYLDNTLNLF